MSQIWEMGDALLALQCSLLALVGASDEVLLVDEVDPLSTLAAKLTRTRARRVASADVFEAIGDHTRALLIVDPTEAQLELSAFELPMILVLRHGAQPPPLDQATARVEVRVQEKRCALYTDGLHTHVQHALEHLVHDWNEAKGLPR